MKEEQNAKLMCIFGTDDMRGCNLYASIELKHALVDHLNDLHNFSTGPDQPRTREGHSGSRGRGPIPPIKIDYGPKSGHFWASTAAAALTPPPAKAVTARKRHEMHFAN